MTDTKLFLNNCKLRGIDFVKERKDELRECLDEQLDATPFRRKTSYKKAVQQIM